MLLHFKGFRPPIARLACRVLLVCSLQLWATHAVALQPELVVGRFAAEPHLDGILSASEGWTEAAPVLFGPSQQGSSGKRATRARVAWRGASLYLALEIPLAPGLDPLARAHPHTDADPPTLMDDSIEIWLGSPATPRILDRMIVNARGAVWDARYTEDAGTWLPNLTWRSGIENAHRIAEGWWTSELRVPLPEDGAARDIAFRLVQHQRRSMHDNSWPSETVPRDPRAQLGNLHLAVRAEPAGSLAVPERADAADCGELWPEALQAAVLHVGYYPYASKLGVHIDLSSVPGAGRLKVGQLMVRRRSNGELIHSANFSLAGASVDAVEVLPELSEGTYDVEVALSAGEGCAPLGGRTGSFEYQVFGWEQNGLGETDDVIPPFTPLSVSGNEIQAVLRRYAMNGLGLFDQIYSAGEPLLAGPAHFRVSVAGIEQTPQAARPLQLKRAGPKRVDSDAEWSAGGLRARVTGTFEIDGMVRLDLELTSEGPTKVDQIDLVIPMRAAQATLMNGISDGTLHHTLGEIPEGSGSVWDSFQVGRWILADEFVPYVWLGNETRGIAWFAESTRGWILAPGRPCQEIVRSGSRVELVIHLVARPSVLRGSRKISFGLQATPTKPRPDQPRSWRLWQLACQARIPVFRICPLPSGEYWGAATSYGNVYPRDGDESILGILAASRRTGRQERHRPAVERWLDDHGVRDSTERAKARAGLFYSLAHLAAKPEAVAAYVNPHGVAWGPEITVYQDEWRPQPFSDRNGGDATANGEIKIQLSQSWNDYVLFYLNRILDSGAVDGFFFDNTFLRASFNAVTGPAYWDEDGVLHPGVDLFAMRDLLRRAQTLVYQRRGAWLNVSHMTTSPVAPIQTWAGISLGGESKYGLDDYQERWPRDLIRAADLGAQAGTVSVFLPGLTGRPSPGTRQRLERSLAGVTAVHEIRVMTQLEGPLETIWKSLLDHGYGRPDTVVKRYWDADRGFSLTGAEAEALIVARSERALALVVSYGAAGEVELAFDHGSLPVVSGGNCSDLEGSGPPPEQTAHGCRFHLDRHDFRLITYTPRGHP